MREITLLPGPPCGKLVWSASTGRLLGFCEKEDDHWGKCSHLFSAYRVWWDGTNRLRATVNARVLERFVESRA